MSETELDELDTVSAESICVELSKQIHALAAESEKVDTQFRTILRKVKHADLWDGETLVLTPKPVTVRWLKAHGWTEPTIPYLEFLRLFFASAQNLDLEAQSLTLNPAEAALFHVQQTATIYQVLRNLPLVFA